MKNLGDQWIELIDGVEHMVKAVEGVLCTGCMFSGMSLFGDDSKRDFHLCSFDGKCPVGAGNRHNLQNPDAIIKDLGVLNEDGCLPNCWGEYPRIEERVDVHTKEHWFRCITRNNVYCATDSYKTKQEAIDAWNRRA